MSGGGDSYRFPPRGAGGDAADEEPAPHLPASAVIALGAGIACVVALVVVEVDDAPVAHVVATASLALAILAAGVALFNAERRDATVRAMAIGGAALGIVASIVSATVDFHRSSPATRAADGTIATAGTVPFTQVRVGDCFRSVPKTDATSIDAVRCDRQHRGEVVAEVALGDQVAADVDAAYTVARQRCQDALRAAVRTSDPAVSSATLVVIPATRSTGLAGLCAVVTRSDRAGSVRS